MFKDGSVQIWTEPSLSLDFYVVL